jgi:hypothetical protein
LVEELSEKQEGQEGHCALAAKEAKILYVFSSLLPKRSALFVSLAFLVLLSRSAPVHPASLHFTAKFLQFTAKQIGVHLRQGKVRRKTAEFLSEM